MTRAPRSTYRLQISEELDLARAAQLLPYLHDLGVDWVYLSPLLEAEAGSTHGYDVVRHDRVDPARGGSEGLAALSAQARRLGLGVLVDVVPNHVGVATPRANPWWWDLLTHGRGSRYADAFDVDWEAGNGRLRVPVVGDDDWTAFGAPVGHLAVDGETLTYHDHVLPLAPGSREAAEADGVRPGDPGFADAVHAHQHYELVSWRVADEGLNYRRFFAVNTLAAIRVEDPEVLAASHVEIQRWFDEGLVDGLRVDHPDGLRDPGGYLTDLAALTGDAYVLVEKILEPGEDLPADWATAGTTGYDALGLVDRVLTDPAGRQPLDELEGILRGGVVDWEEMVHGTKRAVADGILRSEVLRITRELLGSVGGPALVGWEDGAERVADAVAELLACFAVYRSYLPAGREHLDEAVARARTHRPDLDDVLDAVAPVLADPAAPAALRFQQTSGMVMAKGVEDCAFYRYSRLTSLNEVGGDPSVFSLSPDGFHAAMRARQRDWPRAMTTLSTHDTKRGEDVRARITALAEVPEEWASVLGRLLDAAPAPDPGFASLLWQAAVGAWPISRERLHAYAEKAMREAGDHTQWTAPDEAFEAQVHAAVDAVFDDDRVRAEVSTLVARLVAPGWCNALAAKLLSITIPGVPDVYQGSELWEQSLVDPDNRRWVDFDARRRILDGVRQGDRPGLSSAPDDDGAAKLLVTRTALTALRDRPDLFTGYAPVGVSGEASEHVLAFDRGGAVTVVTRLPIGLERRGGLGETRLDLRDGGWTDLVSGRRLLADGGVAAADVLADLPVALLVEEDA